MYGGKEGWGAERKRGGKSGGKEGFWGEDKWEDGRVVGEGGGGNWGKGDRGKGGGGERGRWARGEVGKRGKGKEGSAREGGGEEEGALMDDGPTTRPRFLVRDGWPWTATVCGVLRHFPNSPFCCFSLALSPLPPFFPFAFSLFSKFRMGWKERNGVLACHLAWIFALK